MTAKLYYRRGKTHSVKFETIYKLGETATPEEVTTEGKKRWCCFCYGLINIYMDNYLRI